MVRLTKETSYEQKRNAGRDYANSLRNERERNWLNYQLQLQQIIIDEQNVIRQLNVNPSTKLISIQEAVNDVRNKL